MQDPQKKKKKKRERDLPYDLVIPFLGIHQKELKTDFQRDICNLMCFTTFFLIAQI